MAKKSFWRKIFKTRSEREIKRIEPIAQKIEDIHEHRGHQLYSSIRMTAMLYELFAYLIETGQNNHASTHINDKYVSAACDYIGKSYSNKNLTVEMIAEHICISSSRQRRI